MHGHQYILVIACAVIAHGTVAAGQQRRRPRSVVTSVRREEPEVDLVADGHHGRQDVLAGKALQNIVYPPV